MRSRTPLLLVALALVLVLAGFARASLNAENEPLRVLFVGNSLTHTNDLPAVVATIARKRGTEIEYETIAPGGMSLEDHWNAGRVPAEIASGKWDAVVMQQGPSALPESQVEPARMGGASGGARAQARDAAGAVRRSGPSAIASTPSAM